MKNQTSFFSGRAFLGNRILWCISKWFLSLLARTSTEISSNIHCEVLMARFQKVQNPMWLGPMEIFTFKLVHPPANHQSTKGSYFSSWVSASISLTGGRDFLHASFFPYGGGLSLLCLYKDRTFFASKAR